MANVRIRRGWELSESAVTDEERYWNRRRFIKVSGKFCASLALTSFGCRTAGGTRPHEHSELEPGREPESSPEELGPLEFGMEKLDRPLPPSTRNPTFVVPDNRVIVSHEQAASFNNYYEFTTSKKSVWKRVGAFDTGDWKVRIDGLVEKPQTLDIDDLLRRMPHEERIYRHRCVEAWSMVVPWTGFPMKALLHEVRPLGDAKFVRFYTANRPLQMPGLKNSPWYPWPYHEALRIDEAANDLTMLVTGLYGKPLPRQNGAPLRLVVPWKYGYKSIKSIVRIEFVREQPPTFWQTLEPAEYSFLSNVDPAVPHPRWSQALERDIQTDEKIATLPFNGYGEWVAGLY